MKYASLFLQIALGFYFIQLGLSYIFAPTPELLADFTRWGYPLWFVPVVGVVETVAAVSLLFGTREQHVAAAGALLLAATMIGAVVTHLVAADGGWPLPLILLLLSLIVARIQFPALETWWAERQANQQ